MWKEAVVTYIKALQQQQSGRMTKKHEQYQGYFAHGMDSNRIRPV
jgi:hypothetical protein